MESQPTTVVENAEKPSASEPVSTEESSTATKTKNLDANGKHTLQTGWTFWYDKKPKSRNYNYEENLTKIGSFSTIEDFWSLYAHLLRAAKLPKDSNYHLFREGFKPMWESFPRGGCFIRKIRKAEDVGVHNNSALSRMWEELVIATIGEAFEDPDVVGIVLSIRPKEDAISIWNKDNQNQALRFKIAEVLKDIWGLEGPLTLEYKNHSTSIRDRSTYRVKSASHDETNSNLEQGAMADGTTIQTQ